MKPRVPLSLKYLLLSVMMAVGISHADTPNFVGEKLYYRVSYQGLFSAFAQMTVADASLGTRFYPLPGQDHPLLESVLTVSSADYDFVETIYPFRYRLRTLYSLEPRGSLVFERIKRTRKLKHNLVWIDREHGGIHRFRPGTGGEGPALPAALADWAGTRQLAYDKKRSVTLGQSMQPGLLDWLSLLQTLRALPEPPAAGVSLPVTDGRKQVIYEVRFEGEERLKVDGRWWDTRKYSFSAGKVLEKGQEPPDHNPILAWLSTGAERLPVRLENVHDVGSFVIELRQQPPAKPISVDTPVPVQVSDDSL